MKKKSIFAALFLLAAGLQTAMAQKMIVTLADDSKVSYSLSEVKEVVFVEEEAIGDEHEWVDLGLPSGTLWATCNVGASKPEEYGDYFAWGETKPKTTYTVETYFDDWTYNISGGMTELNQGDDAASVNRGNGWKMPSLDQINELTNSDYTTEEWTRQNGVYGRKVTSKSNGNSIFLPAAGWRNYTNLYGDGSGGYYWSRSLSTNDSGCAYGLCFGTDGFYTSDSGRYEGRSVRPVRVKN